MIYRSAFLTAYVLALWVFVPRVRAEELSRESLKELVESVALSVGLDQNNLTPWRNMPPPSPRAAELAWLRPILEASAPKPVVDNGHPLIPFDISPEIQAFVARNARGSTTSLQVHSVLNAIYSVSDFDDYYESHRTRTASQTLAERRGNCLSFTNLFIACARAMGLEAHYVNASSGSSAVQREGGGQVLSGHVVAEVFTSAGPILVDFSQTISDRRHWYLPLSDLEAVALYINNLGHEAMLQQVNPEPYFRMATQLAPQLSGPWNNLAVYLNRTQRSEEARQVLEDATRSRVPSFAPYLNLGLIYLQNGENERARVNFRKAYMRRPDNPYVVYNLGVAWLRDGHRQLATLAFRRALQLDADMENARGKLERLKAQASRPKLR